MADSKFKTNLTVSASPHLVTTLDTKKTMQYVVLALLPATVMATVYFGIGALLRVILGALFCFVSEYLYNRLMKKRDTTGDCSFAVTGVILAPACKLPDLDGSHWLRSCDRHCEMSVRRHW